MARRVLVRICLLIAILKIVAGGIALAVSSQPPQRPIPDIVYIINIVVFGAVAALLISASRNDNRATHLGVAFALIASSFADPLVRRLPEVMPSSVGPVAGLLSSIHPDAFLPYFLWLFFYDFPRSFNSPAMNRFFRYVFRLSFLIGAALFLINIAGNFSLYSHDNSVTSGLVRLFERKARVSYYWTAIFSLIVVALPLALRRARNARLQERRRVGMFVAGLAIGSMPMMIEVILEVLFPAFKAWMNIPPARQWGGVILYPFLLSVPVTTAYSVLVNRVLDVKLIVRQALQYALARYSVLAMTALPFGGIVLYLYKHRNKTISELISGVPFFVLTGAALVGLLAIRLRQRVFNIIDRKYFRDQYDARMIMANLVEKSRVASGVQELAALLAAEIDQALHLESVVILVRDYSRGVFSSPNGEIRPLSAASSLVGLAEGSVEPLDIDLENVHSLLRRLSVEDQQWLADGSFRLLVPLIGSEGNLIGLIALGGKKSELRFSKEDRMLLKSIAASVSLTLENRFLHISPDRRSELAATLSLSKGNSVEDELATECQRCHIFQPPHASACKACDAETEITQVPYILLGKFRIECKIGSGGMGIVYRAVDLLLRRTVAIKTLPKVSPEYSMRLRREARTMAAVVHPNLALIFGAETWRGTPMLIFEYLNGGTLAHRLRHARLSLEQTFHLGIILADVLERMHGEGILHRDIKPSNIGYTTASTPKLLDFGLAHILADSRRETRLRQSTVDDQSDLPTVSMGIDDLWSLTVTGHIIGTPIYLSPECVQNKAPDPSFDLWAVAITLYECLAGRNPMARSNLTETLASISDCIIPDIRQMAPDCPRHVVDFFDDALAKDKARRPSTAEELRTRLRRVLASLSERSDTLPHARPQ